MSKLGWLLLIAGIALFLGDFTGMIPITLANMGIPLWVWLAVAGVGAVLVMLNRRPGN
jgi:hypothetical protein